MQFDWIASPLLQCAFLALAMLGFLALFVSMKLEIAVVRKSFEKSRELAPRPAVESASGAPEIPELLSSTEVPITVNLPLDSTRRAQALQLQQLGESPAGIAATLGAPRNEIDLLLKIQRIAKGVNPVLKPEDCIN